MFKKSHSKTKIAKLVYLYRERYRTYNFTYERNYQIFNFRYKFLNTIITSYQLLSFAFAVFSKSIVVMVYLVNELHFIIRKPPKPQQVNNGNIY